MTTLHRRTSDSSPHHHRPRVHHRNPMQPPTFTPAPHHYEQHGYCDAPYAHVEQRSRHESSSYRPAHHHVPSAQPYVHTDDFYKYKCRHTRSADSSETLKDDMATSFAPLRRTNDSYVWVDAQEHERSRKVERWVLEQQRLQQHFVYGRLKEDPSPSMGPTPGYYEPRRPAEARKWEEADEKFRKRMARERLEEEANSRLRYAQAREAEHIRTTRERGQEYERVQLQEDWMDWHRREQVQADNQIKEAWVRYEERWRTLFNTNEPLSFATIPWPMVRIPSSPNRITLGAISLFLLSPFHSQGMTDKERVRNAQLRWHPDKFRRLLTRVRESERGMVEEAAGNVARYLNDMGNRARKVVVFPHLSGKLPLTFACYVAALMVLVVMVKMTKLSFYGKLQ